MITAEIIKDHHERCEELKKNLPDGPWNGEPNRKEWKHAGLPCLALRQNSLGHWCGYVGVPKGHPLFGAEYSVETPALKGESPEGFLRVHGGITFSNHCHGNICHVGDAEGDERFWFGFDCAHLGDVSPGSLLYSKKPDDETYKNLAFVERETNKLAKQLAGLKS